MHTHIHLYGHTHAHKHITHCMNTPTQPDIPVYEPVNFMKLVTDGKFITFTLDEDIITWSNRL